MKRFVRSLRAAQALAARATFRFETPPAPNQRWAMAFGPQRLIDERSFRVSPCMQ